MSSEETPRYNDSEYLSVGSESLHQKLVDAVLTPVPEGEQATDAQLIGVSEMLTDGMIGKRALSYTEEKVRQYVIRAPQPDELPEYLDEVTLVVKKGRFGRVKGHVIVVEILGVVNDGEEESGVYQRIDLLAPTVSRRAERRGHTTSHTNDPDRSTITNLLSVLCANTAAARNNPEV
jgi:hypothetical protein